MCVSHTSKPSTPKAVSFKKLKHAFFFCILLGGGKTPRSWVVVIGGLLCVPTYMHTERGFCSVQANMSQLSRNLRRMYSNKTKSPGPAETERSLTRHPLCDNPCASLPWPHSVAAVGNSSSQSSHLLCYQKKSLPIWTPTLYLVSCGPSSGAGPRGLWHGKSLPSAR